MLRYCGVSASSATATRGAAPPSTRAAKQETDAKREIALEAKEDPSFMYLRRTLKIIDGQPTRSRASRVGCRNGPRRLTARFGRSVAGLVPLRRNSRRR